MLNSASMRPVVIFLRRLSNSFRALFYALLTPFLRQPEAADATQTTPRVNGFAATVPLALQRLRRGARVPRLRVRLPNGRTTNHPLVNDRYRVGRNPQECTIVIPVDVVSKLHCSIERDRHSHPPRFTLIDHNSTNGVYLNHVRVTAPLQLQDQMVLTLGDPAFQEIVTVTFLQPPPPPPPLPRRVQLVRSLAMSLTVLGCLLVILMVFVGPSVHPLPELTRRPIILYAQDQSLLKQPPKRVHEEAKQLSEYPDILRKALLASEDSRFYWHLGIDPWGIARAVNNRARRISEEGASTLTQQLARTLFPGYVGRQNTLGRKLREAVMALKLELAYSKRTILLTYMNNIYLGEGVYGFMDAAKTYFRKSPQELSLEEAATLVAMLPQPNYFDLCHRMSLSHQDLKQARERVIDRMQAQSKISREQANQARRSELSPDANYCTALAQEEKRAPYFYDHVSNWELPLLTGNRVANEGSLVVQTALNPQMQTAAERALADAIAQDGSDKGFSQGAIVTLNFETGEILAMVGGNGYEQEGGFNRATQAKRQPASTFKVFTFAAALERGISPKRHYSCAPVSWSNRQFDGCQRTGDSSLNLYDGMALSENPIALRVGQQVGLNRIAQMAQRLGIRSPLSLQPELVLGHSETNLLEMTQAFAAIANRGIANRPHAINKILDSTSCQNPAKPFSCRLFHNYQNDPDFGKQVLSTEVADQMHQLLLGVVQYGTGRAAQIGGEEIAGKTGTSDEYRDLWFIGYLPQRKLITGVWLGNDNYSVATNTRSYRAAQLWRDYMVQVLE